MFQPAPRTHRRLPTGTMVSYAEVKSYLSKREIPQLFESLMAGLMYHRPENHIGYLQSCLEEVKANSETKVQWSTFVNAKKRKSKEILPPLTPKKQDSFSSSWSDNSRQSTPLPPISARTRMRTSIEQQDLRNTYILYHNPPPILAKPKVPVISILGGLGTRIDELCEKVVRRFRGVVHISTCSMLKTRMTIEGFYRITSVPACAVVDSVLQAMSMVQSADALLVAGFPRNRGDIEEYRSRKVRMDGVILVDFEEEALRHFLEHEVTSGIVRTSEVDAELERFKQDIISVAEYYDEKELLTVVMGDQDTEEIVEDLILAVDKIIESRKSICDEEMIEGKKNGECVSPRNALMPSPDRLERPSTVEIRDATEEDVKSIEEESKRSNSKENLEKENGVDEEQKSNAEKSMNKSEDELNKSELKNDEQISDNEAEMELGDNEEMEVGSEKADAKESLEAEKEDESKKSIENSEEKEDLENKISNASEVVAVDDAKNDNNGNDEPVNLDLNINEDNSLNNKDDTAKESESKENSSSLKDDASDDNKQPSEENEETALGVETQSVPLVFSFENIYVDSDEIRNLIANDLEMCFIDFQGLVQRDESNDEQFDTNETFEMLKGILQKDSVSYANGFFVHKLPFSILNEQFIEQLLILGNLNFVCKVRENKSDSLSESKDIEENKLFNSPFSEKIRIIFVTEDNVISELREALQEMVENKSKKSLEIEKDISTNLDKNHENTSKEEANESSDKEKQAISNDDNDIEANVSEKSGKEENGLDHEKEEIPLEEKNLVQEIDAKEENLLDITEDSTGKDVEDIITDTLNEGSKLPESFISGDNPDETVDNTHSQASTLGSAADETQRERAVLERQTGVELEAETEENDEVNQSEKSKTSLIRQGTYSADEMKRERKIEEVDEVSTKDVASEESKENDFNTENVENSCEDKNENPSNNIEETDHNKTEHQEENFEDENKEIQDDLNEAEEVLEAKNTEIEENSSEDKTKQSNEVGDTAEETNEAQEEADHSNEAQEKAEHSNEAQEKAEHSNEAQEEAEHSNEAQEEAEKSNKTQEEGEQSNDAQEEAEQSSEVLEKVDQSKVVDSEGNEEGEREGETVEDVYKNGKDTEESSSKKEEEEEKNENNSEKDGELKDGDVFSEKETDNDEAKVISPDNINENLDNNDNADENSNKVKYEQNLEAISETNEKDLDKNNENTVENSESKKLLQNLTEETSLNQVETQNHSTDSSHKNEKEEASDEKSNEESENDNKDKNDDKNNASFKLSGGIQKTIDNDSDSNDENITIETKAEVHAVDCTSPSISEKSKNQCNQEEENVKSNNDNDENENSTDVKSDNSFNKNKLNEMNNGSLVGNNCDSETMEIRDNNIENERLSGKRQERSGSGILDESREHDPTENEEPQERSSSSSRGEL